MTRGELRTLIAQADIYKMSLGRSARHRKEAIAQGVLVFESEANFYAAVTAGNEAAVRKAGEAVRAPNYPKGGGGEAAIGIWRKSIETFCNLSAGSVILHWEAELDCLYWGISEDPFTVIRQEVNEFDQQALVFHRPLKGGWRKASIGGVPLTNLHPKARDFAINPATINRVANAEGFFRALICDGDTSHWETLPEWKAKAADAHWYPKNRAAILGAKAAAGVTPMVKEAAEHFLDECKRMAATAMHTAAYANGQSVMTVVKNKDIAFTRDVLEEEIADLLAEQGYRCALTGFDFRAKSTNLHLKPSLDRKNSSLGYVPGNLQIVTRAANFYKSASDDEDWAQKAHAMERMAAAMQAARRTKQMLHPPEEAPCANAP